MGTSPDCPDGRTIYRTRMNRTAFSHADEIQLRLSEAADNGRVRRFMSGDAASRLDGLICDLQASQRDLATLLRRKSSPRSLEARSGRDDMDGASAD